MAVHFFCQMQDINTHFVNEICFKNGMLLLKKNPNDSLH